MQDPSTEMKPLMPNHAPSRPSADRTLNRRTFLQTGAAASLSVALPRLAFGSVRGLSEPVRIGVIADLHHDIMHDGLERMKAFTDRMSVVKPDAIMQLGDFAYPRAENQEIIDLFNGAHPESLHVIGNHDMDVGMTRADCIRVWGIPARHYVRRIKGLNIVVLDGNDAGSPAWTGGYHAHVGPEQVAWLKTQLKELEGPIIVVSHQPLAGPSAIDNAEEVRAVLGTASDRVLLAINGHSHVDDLVRVGDVPYLHVNSASYNWVGGKHVHESYPSEIHESHPWISHTCPYRDPLFATLTIDPATATVRVEGAESRWVGPSPAELNVPLRAGLVNGKQVAPIVRDRTIRRGVV